MKTLAPCLFAFTLWSVPATSLACNPKAASSYADITQIYFSSDGLTAPFALPTNAVLEAGNCPETRWSLVWQQGTFMAGSPSCSRSPSGKVVECCATVYETGDPPTQIFARLVAVLDRDRFYNLAEAQASTPTQAGGIFEIAVRRCTPPPAMKTIGSTRAPAPDSQTTVLRIVLPFDAKPGNAVNPGVVRLLNDVTEAIYQSHWEASDVY